MRLRQILKSAPRWIVLDEIGGPVTFHHKQEEAHAAARARGAGRTRVYVAQVLLTNDGEQQHDPAHAASRAPRVPTARVVASRKKTP